MASSPEEKEKQEKSVTIVYDESLTQFMLQHNVNQKNVWSILMAGMPHSSHSITSSNHHNLQALIDEEIANHVNIGGTVFTLPSSRRDGKVCVFWASISSDEIRRVIKLKAFL